MAFLLNKRGEKVHVECDSEWYSQDVVLYSDNAGVRNIYILNLYKGNSGSLLGGQNDGECELIKQIEYWDEPPTKEQIMFKMNENGLSRYDFATIESGYMLDWEDE